MKRINGIIEYRLELKKDQQIDEVEKDEKTQSPMCVRANSRNDTSHRGYWTSMDIGFMSWYTERRLHSRGLEVKCGITNLQRERGSNGVWILHNFTSITVLKEQLHSMDIYIQACLLP